MTDDSPRFARRLLSVLGRLTLAALDVYAVVMIVYLALWLVTRDALWGIVLFSTVMEWLLLPVPIALIVVVSLRQWRRVALQAIPSLAFAILILPLFLPSFPQSACDECTVLRVINLNLESEVSDPDAVVDFILASDADIVALQEIGPTTQPILDDGLAAEYPYFHTYGLGIPGMGIFSRYPILRRGNV